MESKVKQYHQANQRSIHGFEMPELWPPPTYVVVPLKLAYMKLQVSIVYI